MSSSQTPDTIERPEYPDFVGVLVVKLAVRRRALAISQFDLDARIGVTPGLVAKWETGARRPSPYLLWCWVEALGLKLDVCEAHDAAS